MKNRALLFLILLFFTQFLMAQNDKVSARLKEMNNDTLRYIKEQIIANKNYYIGKPLDSLLQDLPISAKRYINVLSNKPYTYKTTYLFLYTQATARVNQKKDPLNLVITWQTPLTKNELSDTGLKSLSGDWTQKVYSFFKDRKIGDLGMVRYDF